MVISNSVFSLFSVCLERVERTHVRDCTQRTCSFAGLFGPMVVCPAVHEHCLNLNKKKSEQLHVKEMHCAV